MTLRRYGDLTSKEMMALDEAIDKLECDWRYDDRPMKIEHEDFGACKSCAYFRSAESEFQIEVAMCCKEGIHRRLHGSRPVRRCNCFQDRNAVDLWQMKHLAIMIDPPERRAGFETE